MIQTEKLIADLQRLPQFEITDAEWGLAKCRNFYIRWLTNSETHIQFGAIETFDKWSNSTNFTIRMIDYTTPYRTDIVKAHLWMEKVCKSELFDFNSYFSSIEAPWFPMENK
jgi:hypothetical protein